MRNVTSEVPATTETADIIAFQNTNELFFENLFGDSDVELMAESFDWLKRFNF